MIFEKTFFLFEMSRSKAKQQQQKFRPNQPGVARDSFVFFFSFFLFISFN